MTNPKVIESVHAGRLTHCYYCEGCKSAHCISVNTPGDTNRWTFTGTLENPTYYPSQLTVYKDFRCHTFITGGMVQFLDDCTHELKGQTLPMPSVPDWMLPYNGGDEEIDD